MSIADEAMQSIIDQAGKSKLQDCTGLRHSIDLICKWLAPDAALVAKAREAVEELARQREPP